MLVKSVLIGLALICAGSVSWAADDEALDTSIHRTFESPRALGMGGAFTAVADDYSALFLNPAGLARREDGELNMSIDLAFSKAFLQFQKDMDTANSAQGDSAKTEAMLNLLRDNYGTYYHLRVAPMSGIWVRPNWGIGVIPADITLNMSIHNLGGSPGVEATAYSDTTIALGFAKDYNEILQNGRLSLGVTGKVINRGYASKALIAADLVQNSEAVSASDLKEGVTADADIGALWTPDSPEGGIISILRLAKPSFAAVVRNVLDYGFVSDLNVYNKDASGKPERLYRVLDLGSKWEYPALWIFGGRGTLDIRDIGHPNWTLRKGFHAGLEFDWRVTSWWKGQYRGGFNQGYWTLGASALFAFFSLDFVTYGEEVGTYNDKRENRNYMIKMNLNF
jgi:hypothetical protein